MAEIKTSEQLKREIAYHVQRLKNTKSADRIHRAHVAIRKHERPFEEAIKREAGVTP